MTGVLRDVLLNYAVCALFGGIAGFLAPERMKKTVRALAVAVVLCGVLLPLCSHRSIEAPSVPDVTEDAAYDDLMHAAGVFENGVRANVRDVLGQLDIHEYDIDVQTACSREEGSVTLTSLTVELGKDYADKTEDVKEALGEYQEVLIVRVKGT